MKNPTDIFQNPTPTDIFQNPTPCRRAWCRGLCRAGFLVLLLLLIGPMTVLCWLEDKAEGNSK